MVKKNLFFYSIYLKSNERNLNYKHFKKIFFDVFQQNCVKISDNVDAMNIEEKVYIDVLWKENNFLYGRIGRIKENTSIQLRDTTTLETEEVLDSKTAKKKGIEIFTYFLIDFDAGIVCSAYSFGAPSIKNLCKIVEKKDEAYSAELIRIVTAGTDILEKLWNCDILYSIEYATPVPSPEFLGNMGIKDRKLLETASESVKYVRAELKGGPRTPLAKTKDAFMQIAKPFTNNSEDFGSLKIKAKIDGEGMETFDILEQYSKHVIDVPGNIYGRDEYQETLKPIMLSAYKSEKNKLKSYCGRQKFK